MDEEKQKRNTGEKEAVAEKKENRNTKIKETEKHE